MDRRTISVIVPTLNAERYIKATLQSIADQIPVDGAFAVQVVVVDGGSTDGTEEAVKQSGFAYEWISIPGLNQAAAINHGFSRSRGEVLCWLNADDLFWPGALATVNDLFAADASLGLIYGRAIAIDSSGRAHGPRRHVRAIAGYDDLLSDDVIVQPAAFWSRAIWDEIGPLRSDLEYVFDYDFFLRVAARHVLVHLPIPLAAERLHSRTKTATGAIPRVEELQRLIEEHTGRVGCVGTFAAEVAATYRAEAIRAAFHGRFRVARSLIRRTPSSRPHRLASIMRLGCALSLGERGYLRTLLTFNALEAMMHGHKLRPGGSR